VVCTVNLSRFEEDATAPLSTGEVEALLALCRAATDGGSRLLTHLTTHRSSPAYRCMYVKEDTFESQVRELIDLS
jgi:hypothetical protein